MIKANEWNKQERKAFNTYVIMIKANECNKQERKAYNTYTIISKSSTLATGKVF